MTLAVLPFVNLGSDPEREYLAAGLTEETSASLAQIDPERLSVKGRTLRYKGTTKTAVEIGQELSVDYLVESTIQAEGGRLRVTATLIRVRDQEHVWSQSYEREPTSLLGLQQELSTAIAEQIRVRLLPDRPGGFGRRQTQNADAYDAYLRGRYFESRRTPASRTRSPSSSTSVRSRSIPDYALAWSSLALTYASSAVNSDARPLEVWPQATEAAARAVRVQSEPRGVAVRRRLRQLVAGLGLARRGERRSGVAIDARSQQRRRCIERWVTRSRRPAGRAKPSRRCAARASSNRWSR